MNLFADTTVKLRATPDGTFAFLHWTSDDSIAQLFINLPHDRLILFFMQKAAVRVLLFLSRPLVCSQSAVGSRWQIV